MMKKPRIVLRTLAVLTAFEAFGGLLLLAITPAGYSAIKSRFASDCPHFDLINLGLVLANLLIVGLLLSSAFLLWRLQRRGLFLLVITLCFEFLCFLGLVIGMMNLKLEGVANAWLIGVAMTAVGVQVYTAYPLIAVPLLVLAYRYLGIPARASE